MALHLNVKFLTGKLHSLDILASRTVWDFKVQVGHQAGVSPYQLKLACQSRAHVDLRDGTQLSEYGLQSGDTILLIVKQEESITIFVRNPKGGSRSYQVLPSDLVDHFKARVQEQEQIRTEQFYLNYEGRTLENGHRLSDYTIAPHGTIYLNLYLRGG
uniref:Ubiquitin-like domain-containing protein n=2 Tax=Varanus komodoensis TaxID=61221 RepID=A0A8D2JEZ8_VARKO